MHARPPRQRLDFTILTTNAPVAQDVAKAELEKRNGAEADTLE
jgi:hypothetical protein